MLRFRSLIVLTVLQCSCSSSSSATACAAVPSDGTISLTGFSEICNAPASVRLSWYTIDGCSTDRVDGPPGNCGPKMAVFLPCAGVGRVMLWGDGSAQWGACSGHWSAN